MFTRTILVSALAFAAAQASAAEFGQWRQVQPGVIERVNADGTANRATYGRAGAQFNYERLKARMTDIENGKVSVLEGVAELRSLYAALTAAGTASAAEPAAESANDDWRASAKIGPVVNAADYTDSICGTHLGQFWSTYTSNATTANLVVTTALSGSGFGPPPPPITQWTITANASFLKSAGGTWNQVDTNEFSPSGSTTTTASNSALRAGYCDGYSLGQVSVFCPAGGGDYASYEQWYTGCP